jgi:hypothetical protein
MKTALVAWRDETTDPDIRVFWGEKPVVSMLKDLGAIKEEGPWIANACGVNFAFWQYTYGSEKDGHVRCTRADEHQ